MRSEARRVQSPDVTAAAYTAPLDALALIAYVALFVIAVLVTLRRPIAAVALLVAVQPFAYYSDVAHTTITLAKVALAGVLCGLFARGDTLRYVAERPALQVLVAGALVIGATALSVTQAEHTGAAVREVFKAIEYVVLFATVYVTYRIDPQPQVVRTAAIAVTAAVSILALSQEVLGAPSSLLLNGTLTPRIAGPLEGPNQLAGYLDISLPLLFAFAIERFDAPLCAALILGACADTLTFSRGGAIGAGAGLVTIGLLYGRTAWRPAITLVAGVVTGVALAHSSDFFRLIEPSKTGGVGTRSELWHAAIVLWRAHPLLGVGAGNFELELGTTGLRGIRTHANSLYLQSLVEGGIPLLAATLFLVWTSIATFARERVRTPLVGGALAASVALAVHQIVDLLTFYPKVGGWWWIVLALGATQLARVRRTDIACAV